MRHELRRRLVWAVAMAAAVGGAGIALTVSDDLVDRPASATRMVEIPEGPDGFTRCGGMAIRWHGPNRPPPADEGRMTVRDQSSGELLLRATDPYGGPIRPTWCGDILQDGRMALLYSTYSMGAHCCTSNYVTLIEKDSTESILVADLGNSGPLVPEQLDGEGSFELVGHSDALAYFSPGGDLRSLSYGGSPSLPLVYAFGGEVYEVATKQFPEVVEEDLEEALGLLENTGDSPDLWERRAGRALRALGDYALFGRLDEGLAALKAGEFGVGPDVSFWLADSVGELQNALRNRYDY